MKRVLTMLAKHCRSSSRQQHNSYIAANAASCQISYRLGRCQAISYLAPAKFVGHADAVPSTTSLWQSQQRWLHVSQCNHSDSGSSLEDATSSTCSDSSSLHLGTAPVAPSAASVPPIAASATSISIEAAVTEAEVAETGSLAAETPSLLQTPSSVLGNRSSSSHGHASTLSLPSAAPPRFYSSSIAADANLLQALNHTPTQYAQGQDILDSIVKVFTVSSRPNQFQPWQNHAKRDSTGTGFVIHDRLILTNAHCVADATYVTVRRHGSGTRYRALVQAVGHDCDLALLSVEDEDFWTAPTTIRPLALGPLPALQNNVIAIGYPTGGDNTSVTSGVVSRVEVTQYSHSGCYLMAIQIDAAINPGNSGGPALQGDQVIGVAFQSMTNADNISYIVPTPVVSHFLAEVARYGQYRGFCSLGAVCQTLENQHLRKALGMPHGATGLLVNNIQQTSTAGQYIKQGDVLMEFNDVPIANDATVHLRQRERIYFSYLITLRPTGETVSVKLLRNGKVLKERFPVQPNETLVPVTMYDKLPQFFIYAGLVFLPLTRPYLMEYGEDWVNSCPRRLYDKAMYEVMTKPAQQIVILSQVLIDDVNVGYQGFGNLVVEKVNGVEVLNLHHLQELCAKPGADGFIRFELEDNRLVAIDASLAREASTRVAERYRIPYLSSEHPAPPTTLPETDSNGTPPLSAVAEM